MERGPARAGRWLGRALLVVGGAVAGTAAAWAIGTASASAATAPPAPAQDVTSEQATPVTDAVLGTGDDVLLGTEQLAGDSAGAAVRLGTGVQSPDSIARGAEAAGDVRDAMHQFTQYAVLNPADRLLGSAEQITREPQDAPRVISQALTPPPGFWNFLRPDGSALINLPALPGTHGGGHQHTQVEPPVAVASAPAPAGPMGPVATTLPREQFPAGHLGSRNEPKRPGGAQPDPFPFDPARGPLAPSGVPSTPGGSAAGGHLDGPLFGVPANAVTVVDASGLRAVRFGLRHTPVQPGAQPGVTPD
ncbi:hypothetical protein FG385_09130 [Amycolatopsis alkalitolerans]|uniref:Uncharacterized protein n=1 Tax=Amycolatopsis alkalitolerans TaxID=2547244 RepID=A0A5C4M8C7_9PSEU|nr:hypothetical protein FG385_09130 [Amycolatopsis alkalitolerans]